MSAVAKGQYPLFDELQAFIFKYLDEKSCVSKELSSCITDAELKLKDIKLEYYQTLLMMTSLKEVLLKHHHKLSSDPMYENEGVYPIVWNLLHSVQAKNCLSLNIGPNEGSTDQSLFGLDRDDFNIDTPKKKLLHQSIQQVLIPQMEDHFKNLSLELFRFVNPTNTDSEGLALAKANKLPHILVSKEEEVEEAKMEMKRVGFQHEETLDEYFTKIGEIFNQLEETYTNDDKRRNSEALKVNIDWLTSKCDYILLKVKMMKNRMHNYTYTSENIEALKKVSHHLAKKIKDTRKEIQKVKHSLDMYKSVGEQFTKLLDEYTTVTNEVDLKKWALAELKSGKQ